MGFNFMSWNVTGLMSSSTYLCDALENKHIDFCGVAEHWLFDHNLHFFRSINNNYKAFAITDQSLKLPSNRRVGKGGVAMLWHQRHDSYVTPMSIDDDRIIGVQFQYAPKHYAFIFQLYLPCSNHPIDFYRDYIDKLHNLWSMYSQHGIVIFMGDFNCSSVTMDGRATTFRNFLKDTDSVAVNTLPFCRGAQSSFVSYDNKSSSLIDYIIIPTEKLDCVDYCEIVDGDCLNVSRHRPIVCALRFPIYVDQSYTDTEAMFDTSKAIKWKRVKNKEVAYFQYMLSECSLIVDAQYKVPRSKGDIVDLYKLLVATLHNMSNCSFKKTVFKKFLKPYWNNDLF